MINYTKIEEKFGYSFPKDLEKLKLLVENSNSKSQLVELSGISISYIEQLLKEFKLQIVPKCLYCGKELSRSHDGTVKKYCNASCQYSHKTTVIKCRTCGKNFEARKGVKYCSDKCKGQGYKSKLLVCSVCGKEFIGHGSSKYCSNTCYREANKNNNNLLLICSVCGKEYVGSKYSTYYICSNECRNRLATHRARALMLELFGTANKEEIRHKVKEGSING